MSVNGSFLVSLSSIMGALPVLYHQQRTEADVGKILQIVIQAFRCNIGDFLYQAGSV